MPSRLVTSAHLWSISPVSVSSVAGLDWARGNWTSRTSRTQDSSSWKQRGGDIVSWHVRWPADWEQRRTTQSDPRRDETLRGYCCLGLHHWGRFLKQAITFNIEFLHSRQPTLSIQYFSYSSSSECKWQMGCRNVNISLSEEDLMQFTENKLFGFKLFQVNYNSHIVY